MVGDEEEISTYNSSENSDSEGSELDLDESESSNAHYTGDEDNEAKGGDTDEYNDMSNRSKYSGQGYCKRSVRRSKRIVNAVNRNPTK